MRQVGTRGGNVDANLFAQQQSTSHMLKKTQKPPVVSYGCVHLTDGYVSLLARCPVVSCLPGLGDGYMCRFRVSTYQEE